MAIEKSGSEPMKAVTIELPYPPTINTYWRRNGSRYFIAAKGVAFRSDVLATVLELGVQKLAGPLAFSVLLYPPDRRVRDVDNVIKPIFDALAHAGVIENDSQFKRLSAEMCEVVSGGRSVVMLERM
jgi:crossover junction endodeoxyribonuclease RusA